MRLNGVNDLEITATLVPRAAAAYGRQLKYKIEWMFLKYSINFLSRSSFQ